MKRIVGVIKNSCSLTMWGVFIVLFVPLLVHADRSAMQGDPALMYEKAGKFAEAALYYQRALRGWNEFYVPFLWGEVENAPGRYKDDYKQLGIEYEERVKNCLSQANLSAAERERMEMINELWLSELIDQEEGEVRTETRRRAEESEKRGDFLLAEVLRRGDARFCQVVAIPYHQKAALECEKRGRKNEAELYRRAVRLYEQRAEEADLLAQGDKILMKIPGLGGPNPWPEITLGRAGPISIPAAYLGRVVTADGQWKGKSPVEVAAILKEQGLKHKDEVARFAAVIALANLGEKEAVLSALNDSSGRVRVAAAKRLARMRWVDGWAACQKHTDAEVRAAVENLLNPAGKYVLTKTIVITELMKGLNSPLEKGARGLSSSADISDFCQTALERITGEKMQAEEWATWWKSLGNPQAGLTRTGEGAPPAVDETVDFGGWWQSGKGSILHLSNPLLQYPLPAKVQWTGHLVVTQAGDYQFYVRSCGEDPQIAKRRVQTPGRVGFPGLYFSSPCAKLIVDGNTVLPNELSDVMEDPAGGLRLDFSKPMRLESGLHPIHLEFEIRSHVDQKKDTGIVGGTPSVRLYWSSEHFLRELAPAENLITKP
jgi:tetratricopeptide (TPR) repeat protein